MHKKVALIHTSFVLINRDRLLLDTFAEILPEVELVHIVDDGMLREVINSGEISPQITRRMCFYVMAAEAMEVDAIFNTCSSLGPAFDVAKRLVSTPSVKIDDGMAQKAVEAGEKIAVLATVPTTLPPTIALIKMKAAEINKTAEIKEILCKGAFELLMQGEGERHDELVSQAAQGVAKWADTVVLAQASMTRLAARLSDETALPVLSSPRLGVQHLKNVLFAQDKSSGS
jgi:Asp/Glu/hydantoin racemase